MAIGAVVLVLVLLRPDAGTLAVAAQLDGVTLPDTRSVEGTALRLNGAGVRTYSLFRVHIYIAALYLPQPTSDAEAILHSDAAKLLEVNFVHDVSAARARAAWITAIDKNCRPPCRVPSALVEQFLAAVPELHKGDRNTLWFTGNSVQFTMNGRPLGTVTDPAFSRVILATFIGEYPSTEPLKRGLLGLPN